MPRQRCALLLALALVGGGVSLDSEVAAAGDFKSSGPVVSPTMAIKVSASASSSSAIRSATEPGHSGESSATQSVQVDEKGCRPGPFQRSQGTILCAA